MEKKSLKELKERLIEERAISQNDAKNTKIAIDKFKENAAGFNEDSNRVMEEVGVEIGFLKNIDYERLATDQEYVNTVRSSIDAACSSAYKNIMDKLDAK